MSSAQQLTAQQQSQLAPGQRSQVAKRDASADLDAFARRPFAGDMLAAFGLGDVGRSLDRQLARAEANVPRLLVDVVEKCAVPRASSPRARVPTPSRGDASRPPDRPAPHPLPQRQ